MTSVRPIYFTTASEFRLWLEENHDSARELVVGFRKKASGRPSMTWQEAVDEALCFGWIDSVRRSVDETRYTNRFTPRRRGSVWSKRNIERVEELTKQGRMHPAGIKASEARSEERSGIYSFDQREAAKLGSAEERLFRSNATAWKNFRALSPSYQRAAIWWVVSAKKEETRQRRLATLIEDSEQGRTVRPLTPRRPRRSS